MRAQRRSILLLGPRQTGKSTLMRYLAPTEELNLAKESLFLELQSSPARFDEWLEKHARPGTTLFIDEIQRIPSLLNSIQHWLDAPRSGSEKTPRFFLTGSSARKLRRGQANLLPGRILSATLGGFAAAELDYRMDTERALSLGTLPGVYLNDDTEEAREILRTYAAIYLREEVQAEAISRNIAGFSRFLMEVASFSGHVLDISKLASKAKVSRTSTQRFLEVLEDTLLGERIPCYEGFPDLEVIRHPKFFLFDVGAVNGLLGNFTASADRRGLLFEHLLYAQLRHSASAFRKDVKIAFLRTRGGLEVDFVVHVDDRTYLVEARSTAPDAADMRSIESVFAANRKRVHGAFVAVSKPVTERVRRGISVLPWQKVLREIGL